MKKITLLVASLFIGATALAQDIVIERPIDGAFALPSVVGEDGFGVILADHFILEEETLLGEFYFPGIAFDANYDKNSITGFNLFIFTHDEDKEEPDGHPILQESNAVLELKNIPLDKFEIEYTPIDDVDASIVDFRVNVTIANDDTDVTLPAGEYWVSPSVIVNQGSYNGPNSWSWIESGTSQKEHTPMAVSGPNEDNQVTIWTSVTEGFRDLEEFNTFAWTLTDGGILGVEDFETNSFKHVVKNNQLLISSDLKINNVVIYNSLGQKVASQSVNATSANINLSNLSSGVYFTQADVNGEMKTFKFAK